MFQPKLHHMPRDAALIGRAARLSGRNSCCAQRQPAFFSSIMHTITRQRLFTEIALAAGICLVAAAFFIAGCGRPDSDSTASSSPSAGADAKARILPSNAAQGAHPQEVADSLFPDHEDAIEMVLALDPETGAIVPKEDEVHLDV